MSKILINSPMNKICVRISHLSVKITLQVEIIFKEIVCVCVQLFARVCFVFTVINTTFLFSLFLPLQVVNFQILYLCIKNTPLVTAAACCFLSYVLPTSPFMYDIFFNFILSVICKSQRAKSQERE